MDMTTTLGISGNGMDAQSERLRIIAQNLANANTTGSTPGADPYRRQTVIFQNTMDRALGTTAVKVKQVAHDMTEFPRHYDPSNPAADSTGYVKSPNVNSFVEVMDMKEAQRSYAANLNVMEATRGMMNRTLDLLK